MKNFDIAKIITDTTNETLTENPELLTAMIIKLVKATEEIRNADTSNETFGQVCREIFAPFSIINTLSTLNVLRKLGILSDDYEEIV